MLAQGEERLRTWPGVPDFKQAARQAVRAWPRDSGRALLAGRGAARRRLLAATSASNPPRSLLRLLSALQR